MAVKKSELYSSLWASCDKLRGAMDPSQYKDYVLVLLFVKYVSDKYGNDADALIQIPQGGSFKDMQALKGSKDIGEKIDKAISALAKANDLENVIDVVSFQDDEKLGKGKDMVDKLTDLIAIFERPALNFSKNRAQGDDILGDAYEYLMRNFASESGKSKGEFYTPGEVSRVLAKVIGVKHGTATKQTIYDPTCGSGSLLLKVADEAEGAANIYGQEKNNVTTALAKMNMILHNNPEADIAKGGDSTLSKPFFTNDEDGGLKTFDFVVANPPFSSKNWMDGFNPSEDLYRRFENGIPPEKNGDYAFLLHIIKSLKNTGKGACILPHGVLFRGNAEAEIRKNIIERGYIKGIIGLPANLFYGTGIPACIIVLDMEHATATKDLDGAQRGIFMIDASKGFIKDGNKNRLREQDIHKIVDVFTKQLEIPKYSRFISYDEISDPKNDFNLNIPRYIDSQEIEDIQDIEAHLLGGIPNADIDALNEFWDVYPNLRSELFKDGTRPNYSQLKINQNNIKSTIFHYPEFLSFSAEMDKLFNEWKIQTTQQLKALDKGLKPKEIIQNIAESILAKYTNKQLIDKYAVYQHVMDYWNSTMQDDTYLIAVDGWVAEPYRIIVVSDKTKKETDKGWECDLVPKKLVIERYFKTQQQIIDQLEADKEVIASQITELEEDLPDGVEENEWILNEVKNAKGKITKTLVDDKTKELKMRILNIPIGTSSKEVNKKIKNNFEKIQRNEENNELFQQLEILQKYNTLNKKDGEIQDQLKFAIEELDHVALELYNTLTEDEIKQLVVEDKWIASIEHSVKTEMERISQRLTQRIKELAERYDTPLSTQTSKVAELETKVMAHLQKMGFVWN